MPRGCPVDTWVAHDGRPSPRAAVPRLTSFSSAVAGALAASLLTGVGRRRRRLALGAALDRAGLFDELVRHERRQQEAVAARLHDGPLQTLIAARQDLLEHLSGEDVDLEETADALGEAVTGLRDLTTDLYDAVLRDEGLEAALSRSARDTEQRGGPPVTVTVGPNASGEHDALVVRVANELLTNVRKHAEADRAWVRVVRTDDRDVRLTVGDDGVGMDPEVLAAAARDGHVGLRSITRRVSEAGGAVRTRALSPGSEVEVRLPGPAA